MSVPPGIGGQLAHEPQPLWNSSVPPNVCYHNLTLFFLPWKPVPSPGLCEGTAEPNVHSLPRNTSQDCRVKCALPHNTAQVHIWLSMGHTQASLWNSCMIYRCTTPAAALAACRYWLLPATGWPRWLQTRSRRAPVGRRCSTSAMASKRAAARWPRECCVAAWACCRSPWRAPSNLAWGGSWGAWARWASGFKAIIPWGDSGGCTRSVDSWLECALHGGMALTPRRPVRS